MRHRMRMAFAFWLLAAAIPAQEPGQEPEAVGPLPIKQWLSGEPVRFSGDQPAKLALIALLPSAAALPEVQDALAGLQRRHGDAGLRVAAMLAKAPERPLQPPPPFALALGLEGEDGGRQRGRSEPVVLCLFDGEDVLWQGTLANGPGQVIADILAHKLDRQALQRFGELRGDLLAADDFGFEYGLGAELLQRADALLALNRTDGAAWALRYCVASQKLADAKLAAATLRDALSALADQPQALGLCCDLVLRSDPFTDKLGEQMWPLLTQAVPMAPADPTLQLAALRALVRAGKDREVGRRSQQLRKQFDGDALALVHLAEILAGDRTPAVYRDTAERALQRAEQLGGELDDEFAAIPLLLGVRYKVALRCAGDAKAAKAIADALVERIGGASGLNDCAWYTMARTSTRGRCDELASALCSRMLERRDQLPGNELDTAALGMFLCGKVELAVELQQAAMKTGAGQKPEYEERLHRYQAALPTTPR